MKTKHRTDMIMSAFQNEMDWNKVEDYAQLMIEMDIYYEFPPILGFEKIITEEELGHNFIRNENEFESGLIKKEHLGMKCWVVTDGHHRVFAIRKAKYETKLLCFDWIETEIDYSTITSKKEKELYYDQNSNN